MGAEVSEQMFRSVVSLIRKLPVFSSQASLELWFQQDGATCHTARAIIDLLKDTFGVRLISRFGPVNWPPRSCDLTPLDYFLWGYVKLLVYADKPQTLDHLEDNIRRVIADIRPQMLEKVIENWTSRLDYIRASRGSPMPEILFKMWQRGLIRSPAHARVPSERQSAFTSRGEQLVSVGSAHSPNRYICDDKLVLKGILKMYHETPTIAFAQEKEMPPVCNFEDL
ncbi:transposable element Tc3 transposase [Trichonephila clavipes]|nr:transposable element Tc3 transposase [Trichonephila clavipes]